LVRPRSNQAYPHIGNKLSNKELIDKSWHTKEDVCDISSILYILKLH